MLAPIAFFFVLLFTFVHELNLRLGEGELSRMLFGRTVAMAHTNAQVTGAETRTMLRSGQHLMLLGWSCALVGALGLWPCAATARSLHVRESRPAAEAIIHGRHAEYVIYFDGPVDHAASRLQITQSGRMVQALVPRLNSGVDVLFADGEAPPAGRYLLHWEAKSADGDVSTGDIPFSVAP